MSKPTETTANVSVWDPLLRVLHWALALAIATAWLTSDHPKALHQWAGYVAGILIVIRLVWGFAGPRRARFASFVKGPRPVLAYLRDIGRGAERRFIGHNPAGGAMIVALLTLVGAEVVIGWLQTTDVFWGVEWIEKLHALNARLILLLIGFHLLGVVVASFRHRENLPLAMLTGKKRAPSGDDVG